MHRVHTFATPAEVWELVGNPSAWSQFDLFLRGVRGHHTRTVTGARLMAMLRLSAVGVPVDVVEAVPERRLVVLVHVAPGLREQITCELTSAMRGGTDISVSVVVEGVLARAAVLPIWLYEGFTTRVLAATTDRLARQARRRAA